MQKLIFRNSKGVEIDFTSGNFGIVDWSGLSDTELNIQTQQVPFNDGSVFIDALLNDRTITVTVAINDDGNLQSRYSLKRQLIQMLNPKLGTGTLIYSNDYLSKQISCLPELPVFNNKNANDSGTLKCSISFYCCSPYWEDLTETSVEIEKGEEVVISNTGDVESPIDVELSFSNAENPKLVNIEQNKFIQLKGIHDGEYHLSTIPGNKKIYKREKIVITNEIFNITNDICYSAKHNLYVAVGENGLILKSVNLREWEVCGNSTDTLNVVYYCEKLDLFITAGTQVVTSNDGGETWNVDKTITSLLPIYDIKYSEKFNLIIICGKKHLYYSTDGITWSTQSWGESVYLRALFVDDDAGIVLMGTSKGMYYSTDGHNFHTRTGYNTERGCTSITKHLKNGYYVANDTTDYVDGSRKVDISYDGINWKEYDIEKYIDNLSYDTETGKIISECMESESHAESYDGINWEFSDSELGIKKMKYENNKNQFIACGYNIYTSSNGSNFVKKLPNTGNLTLIKKLNDYYEDENVSIGVGDDKYLIVKKNSNKWKQIIIETTYTNVNFLNVIKDEKSDKIVIVSPVGIWYSTDYENWTFVDNFLNEETTSRLYLRYGTYDNVNKQFLVCGSNLWSSKDGENWVILSYMGEDYITYSSSLKCWLAVVGNRVFTFNSDFTEVVSQTYSGVYTTVNFTCIEYVESNGSYLISDDNRFVYRVFDLSNPFGFERFLNFNYPVNLIKYCKSEDVYVIIGENGIYYISEDGETWEKINTSGSIKSILEKESEYVVVGSSYMRNSSIDKTNVIHHMTADSSINLNIECGNNTFELISDSGNAKCKIKFKNRFVGV